ncbi:MAG: Modification methylase DpnIIB [Parcubacteria group bacterium ADurb.Bin216]|nr:MAG: Modification methylase DpnIIB [Parcubacteria group bacterium ADurb.Bin216]
MQYQGRFPANLIHDGSDEVVELFPNTGKGNGGNPYSYKGKEYDNKDTSMFNGDKPQAPSNFNDSGSASRFFYCAKASKRERNIGCEGIPEKEYVQFQTANGTSGKASSLSEGRNTKYRNIHPTVKPLALMEYLVKLVSREGQVVLDPFMGSGTTGMACKRLGREFIGIEMMPDYMEIAKARIDGVKESKQLEQLNLLKDNK